MNTKKEFTLLKKIAKKNKSISLLEGALIQDGRIIVTDLHTNMSFPTDIKGEGIVPLHELAKAKYDKAYFEGEYLVMKKGANTFKIKQQDKIEDYPTFIECKTHVGTFKEVDNLKKAAEFASNDALRPVMNCVNLDTHKMVATDMHNLYAKNRNNPDVTGLVPKKIAKLLIEEAYEVYINKEKGWFEYRGKKQLLSFQEVEGNYPKYEVVIPSRASATVEISTKDMIDALETAIPFSNGTTKKGVFTFKTTEIALKVLDSDYENQASLTVPVKKSEGMPDNCFRAGFNLEFIKKLLKAQDTQTTKLYLPHEANRALFINDNSLLMPLMLEDEESGWAETPVGDVKIPYKGALAEKPEPDPEPTPEEETEQPDTTPEPTPEEEAEQPDTTPEPTPEEQPVQGQGIAVVDYSEKAIAVIGNTKPFKKQLKKAYGKWNPFIKIGETKGCWIFSKKRKPEIEKLIENL